MKLEFIKKKPLWVILLIAVIIRVFYLLTNQTLWWDSHVYVEMGKFIFSGGHLGIWESFRPLILPLVLGSFWKMKLDHIFIGKILDLIISTISVYLLYLITSKAFNKKIALIGSLLFATSPLYLIFTGLVLTEPLAIFFGLLGIFFFMRRKNETDLLWTGIFLGLSFLTKFPQGLYFGAIFMVILFEKEKIFSKIVNLIVISLGFLVTIAPYFIFNHLQYGNYLQPLIDASAIVTTSTWEYGSGLGFYFINLFLSNPIHLFFIGYLYFYLKEKHWKDYCKNVILFITILIFIYFHTVPRKELRYMVSLIPFLLIGSAYVLNKIYESLKETKKPIIRPKAFIILTIILVIIFIPSALHFNNQLQINSEINKIIIDNDIKGPIIVTDLSFVSGKEISIITFSGMEYAKAVYEFHQDKYQMIIINECDLICAPDDLGCDSEKKSLLDKIKKENKLEYQEEVDGCNYGIYLPKEINQS